MKKFFFKNVFLCTDDDGRDVIKLGDFGITKNMKNEKFAFSYLSNQSYHSKELKSATGYTNKLDIHYLGFFSF